MTELPVVGYSPEAPAKPSVDIVQVVSDIAEQIKPDNPLGDVSVRVGVVTAVESSSPYRVQLDITGTAWLSRTADVFVGVGDTVWAMQQGEVFIVVGRLNSSSSVSPVGVVEVFAGSTPPTGWLLCDGSSVLRASYPALFSVIGTTYGSVDSTHFTLPNLEDRVPVGSGNSYSRGSTGGASTVTITSSTMPSHTHSHTLTAGSGGSHSHSASTGSDSHSHSVGNQTTRSDVRADAGSTTAADGSGSTGSDSHSHSVTVDSGGSHTHSMSGSISSTGSGNPHENMQPYIAMPYIIRAL